MNIVPNIDTAQKKLAKRRKISVAPSVVSQAIHHLGNFLTITTAMSNHACAVAPDPDSAKQARKAFFQLFGEVAATMAALDEAANPNGNEVVAQALENIRSSPEYKELICRAEADRIAECYVFNNALACESMDKAYAAEVCYRVALVHPCRDFGGWLIGRTCTINGSPYAVMAVQYAPLRPPFAAGDKVTLVVRAVAADGTVADKPQGDNDVRPTSDESGTTAAAPAASNAQALHPADPGSGVAAAADGSAAPVPA